MSALAKTAKLAGSRGLSDAMRELLFRIPDTPGDLPRFCDKGVLDALIRRDLVDLAPGKGWSKSDKGRRVAAEIAGRP